MDEKEWETMYEFEYAKAKEIVDAWVGSDSEQDLVQSLMDEEEINAEAARVNISSAVQVAIDALTRIQLYSAELREIDESTK
jgi:hypothetical protein